MKKSTSPAKLMLKLETVKALKPGELARAIGGADTLLNQPTTTVHHTFDC